jgi:lipoprotein-anchoring transpeptidase ErfK/SrfK
VPLALVLDARSDVLAEFDRGPGQIALHGIENIGATPATAASHGCMRLDTPDITWLAAHIGPGVPVTIRVQPANSPPAGAGG